MTVTSDIRPGTYGDFFGRFVADFPDVESRYAAALQIAQPPDDVIGDEELPQVEYLSRNYFLAHWGDSDEQLKELSDYVYRLKAVTGLCTGQPVFVFKKGTPTDILSDDERLATDINFEYGFTTTLKIKHGYDGNITDTGTREPRFGLAPPYLRFGIQLPIRDYQRVVAKKESRKSVMGISRIEVPKNKLVTAVGAVSLRPDIDNYAATRVSIRRPVVVGHTACRRVLEALADKTVGLQRDQVAGLSA